jgi:hypothetical protein
MRSETRPFPSRLPHVETGPHPGGALRWRPAALIAAQNGATILRVHDVGATRDAMRVWEAVRKA